MTSYAVLNERFSFVNAPSYQTIPLIHLEIESSLLPSFLLLFLAKSPSRWVRTESGFVSTWGRYIEINFPGVPKFFRWMSERYPAISQLIAENRIPEFDCLYLDMNGIIHNCTHKDSDSPTFRMTEDKMFIQIFNYIGTVLKVGILSDKAELFFCRAPL